MSTATIDIFDTRSMMEALVEVKEPQTFFLQTFFPNASQSMTENIDIDIVKNKRRIAPFVSPLSEGKAIDRIGFKTNSYKPPYIKPKMRTTAQDFLHRMAGETIYGPNDSALSRASKRVAEDLMTMDDMITRREEWMASQVLQTGIINVVGEGVNDVIDFQFAGSHVPTLGGTDVWDNAASDPMQDLHTWRRLILKDSGLAPTDVVLGESAADAFLANAAVKDRFNKWWMQFGQVNVNVTQNRHIIHLGRIQELNMDFWVYSEWFIDPADGIEKAIMDEKKVILGTRGAYTARHYGAIQDVEADATTTFATSRFPKSWVTKDPSARWLMVQSAPLPAIHEVDAFLCAKVLA